MKTIEAMALGKPFVGTSKAYRGMPMDLIEDAGLRAHDAPQEFAQAIVAVLSEPAAAAKASETAYERLFSERVSFAARDQALRLVGAWDGSAERIASAHDKVPSSLQEVNR